MPGNCDSSSVNFNQLAGRMRRWDGQPLLADALKMQLDRFMDELHHFISAACDSNAARQVGHICTEARRTLLNDDKILHWTPHFLRLACFKMLLNVPGGTSMLGFPATVTVPSLEG